MNLLHTKFLETWLPAIHASRREAFSLHLADLVRSLQNKQTKQASRFSLARRWFLREKFCRLQREHNRIRATLEAFSVHIRMESPRVMKQIAKLKGKQAYIHEYLIQVNKKLAGLR